MKIDIHKPVSYHIYIISVLLLFALAQPAVAQEADYIRHTIEYKVPVTAVNVSPDGRWLLAGFEDGTLRVLNTNDFVEHLVIEQAGAEAIFDIEMSPLMDVIFIAAGSRISLYDTLGVRINTWSHHRNTIWSMDLSPDGSLMAATEVNKTFQLIDVFEGTSEPMRAHDDITMAVEFSPDGKLLASGSSDRQVFLWDVATRQVVQTLHGMGDNIYDVTFSPDGSLVAACSRDETVRIWNIAENKLLHLLEGHMGMVFEVEFSPDGKYLLSASADQAIKLWDVASGKQLYPYLESESSVPDIVFLPGGTSFSSAGMEGKLRIWGIDPEIFVMKYFGEAYEEALDDPIFEPRRKGEKRSEFEVREAEAAGKKQVIIDSLYIRFQEEVEGK